MSDLITLGMAQKIEKRPAEKIEAIFFDLTIDKQQHTQLFDHKTISMPLKYTKNEDGNFVCPDCGVVKKNQNTMHYHMKKHEEQLNHVCKECKKGFLQKQTLDLHMRSKHPQLLKDNNEDAKKFKCPFDNCEFSALTKGNCIIHCLRVHFQEEIKDIMLVDNETKMIQCNECYSEFSSQCAFYYHCKKCLDTQSAKYSKLSTF